MTRPFKYLVRMILFVIALNAAAYYLQDGIKAAFLASPILNTAILVTFAIGAFLAFRNLILVDGDVSWIQTYRHDGAVEIEDRTNYLGALAPALLATRGAPRLPADRLQSALDGVSARLEDARESERFLVNVLILLGLMGTFWGLLTTISGISSVMGSLVIGEGDLAVVFERLKDGLSAPLAGMAISFSCSLFGVSTSLALGLLDLQVGLAHRRFCDDLEEWLSRVAGSPAQEATIPAGRQVAETSPIYLQALIQQLADNTEDLQRAVTARESADSADRAALRVIGEQLSQLGDYLKKQHGALSRLSESHGEVSAALKSLASSLEAGALGDVVQAHLRNIDVATRELVQDMGASRGQLIHEIRQELKLLGRMLSSTASVNR